MWAYCRHTKNSKTSYAGTIKTIFDLLKCGPWSIVVDNTHTQFFTWCDGLGVIGIGHIAGMILDNVQHFQVYITNTD